MPKAPTEIPDLDGYTDLLVSEPPANGAGVSAEPQSVLRRALARVRQVARFFYTLLTES
jgi:hypothetical protein